MSIYDTISQYSKLAEQFSSQSGGGGLLDMAKQLLGGSANDLIQKFLVALPPELIQKLSVLKSLGAGEGGSVDSKENFIDTFKQLATQFSTQDTDKQVSELSNLSNANLISKAAEMAKQFGINLDNLHTS